MSKSKSVLPIMITLSDIITPKSCSLFIAELIKYVIYHKLQIPYPYERLKMFVLRRRERQRKIELSNCSQESETSVRVAFLMEKYYKKVEEAFEILESTFKCIEQELMKTNEHNVEEIVLLFGATPLSPKDVYRIKIPPLSYGHSEGQHLWKRQIGNLFRDLIISDEFNANIQRKVGLTNVFVMIKVKENGFITSKWLLPKDHYRLSERVHQVCFSFTSLSSKICSCATEMSRSFTLSERIAAVKICDDNSMLCEDVCCNNTTSEYDDHCRWFQTPRSLKGFKDCKTQGKSVTDLWYKYSFI